ncbi:MAG: diguanylate cyclase [Rhodocyclaceae bacterium]|nr:diguanylate cyclase [Rhodocyclaceae bacterium]
MKLPHFGFRGRLLFGAVLPALVMVALLEVVFLSRYQSDLEFVFQERGHAIARQLGAAAEYALFSGSHETLGLLADGTRQGDPAIVSVSVLDLRGQPLVRSGRQPQQTLPLADMLQVINGEHVTTVQTPIQQAVLPLDGSLSVAAAAALPLRSQITGYIVVEVSREALSARKREMLRITLAIMLGGLLLASWLSLRISASVLSSLDATAKALRRQKESAEMLARTDVLTGLANRRAFDEAGQLEIQRAQRYATPLSLVITDLDYFKAINDQYGHHVGDRVLQHFALILSESVRNVDLVGRWGGEEFAILMPGTDLEEAVQVAERMRVAVADAPRIEGLAGGYTASFGVAAFRSDTPTMVSLLGRADAALYDAKNKGRNRVEVG